MNGSPLKISHIVLVPKEISDAKTTLFEGFSKMLVNDYSWVFQGITYFPNDIIELYCTKEEYIKKRMRSPMLSVHLLREDLLDKSNIRLLESFFNILWSTEATYEAAHKCLSLFDYNPIHISSKLNSDALGVGNIDIENILKEKFRNHASNNSDSEINNLFNILTKKEKIELLANTPKINSYNHNIFQPLLSVLATYGCQISLDQIDIGKDTEFYINHMKILGDNIDDIRRKINTRNQNIINDVLIYCPSIYGFLYNCNSKDWKDFVRRTGLNKIQKEIIKKCIVRIKGYSSCKIKDIEDYNPQDEIMMPLLFERAAELSLFSSVISILASSQFVASYRLPHAVMLHHNILNDFAHLLVSPKKSTVKLNRTVSKYSKSIINEMGNVLLNLCFHSRKNLLAVCDFPIEWVSVDSIPLMYTHEISRVCTTPGNLLIRQLLSIEPINIPYSLFSKILIIRSYKDNDPIKHCLSQCMETYENNGDFSNLNINIVDVSTEIEIIKALNIFKGAIVIFDCHGNHGGIYKGGWLEIGSNQIDIWELSNKCVMKPIVILSACSTHPVEGSHASVVNGFFNGGVISVLGTYGAVDALHSAIFVVRILHRISEYVPIILEGSSLNWRTIISGILKMSYATDVLRGMLTEKIISEEQYDEIHMLANIKINTNERDWHIKFFDKIAKMTNKSLEDIKKIVDKKYQYTPTMLYTQLGRPENIIITNDILDT